VNKKIRTALLFAATLAIFSAGYGAGVNRPDAFRDTGRSVSSGSDRFGMPKTVLHVVIIRWKPGTTAAQKQAVIDGVREMAARIPGIRNIWVKPARVGSLTWNAAFAIEFADRAAADRYANDPAHAAWAKIEEAVRANSLNVQITN